MSRRHDIGGVDYFHLTSTGALGDTYAWVRVIDPTPASCIPCDRDGWISVSDYPPGRDGLREQIMCCWHVGGVPVIRLEYRDSLPATVECWQPLPALPPHRPHTENR